MLGLGAIALAAMLRPPDLGFGPANTVQKIEKFDTVRADQLVSFPQHDTKARPVRRIRFGKLGDLLTEHELGYAESGPLGTIYPYPPATIGK